MSHPVDPDREDTRVVFRALLETLPEAERQAWLDRWMAARDVERRRRDYDEAWTRSGYTIQRGGQGGG